MLSGTKGRFIFLAAAALASLAAVAVLPAPARAGSGFSDLRGGWAYLDVAKLRARGVVSGFPDGTFQPSRPVTRAEFAKMLVEALGSGDEARGLGLVPSRFRDVQWNHWAKGYIEVAAELGLVKGSPSGGFRPGDRITRAEVVVELVRALGWEPSVAQGGAAPPFDDAGSIPAWASGHVSQAAARGLVAGYGDGTFRPDAYTGRAEAAVLLVRLMRWKGLLWDLSGVLKSVDYAADTFRMKVDDGGALLPLRYDPGLEVNRNGVSVPPSYLRPLDQVFLILDSSGTIRYLEAYFYDAIGLVESVDPWSSTLLLRPGEAPERDVRLAAGAPVYRNGRPARFSDVRVGDRVYVVYDCVSWGARVLDAVRPDLVGKVEEVREILKRLTIRLVGGTVKSFPVGDAVVFLNGRRASFRDVRRGDWLVAALENGGIVYLEASRTWQ